METREIGFFAAGVVYAVFMLFARERLQRRRARKATRIDERLNAERAFKEFRAWLIAQPSPEPCRTREEYTDVARFWHKLLPACREIDANYRRLCGPLTFELSTEGFVLQVERTLAGVSGGSEAISA